MIKTIDLNFLDQSQTIGAFLYETSAGPILFETGPYSTFKQLCAGIRAHGYEPEDIKHVFITHIHLDHAGAAWAMAELGAKIYVHPLGKDHLIDPEKLIASAKRIYQDKMDTLWGDMRPIAKRLVVSVKDVEMTKIGDTIVRCWHTPGHAKHHIAWQVNRELIAGDVAGVKIGSGPVVAPCPPPDIDLEAWSHSLRRMKALDLNRVHLTHFGSVVNLDNHVKQLTAVLNDWAEWVKPYAQAQSPKGKVVPLFEAYVKEYLESKGLNAEQIAAYEKANPSWMSAVGLMRYWTKQLDIS